LAMNGKNITFSILLNVIKFLPEHPNNPNNPY